MQKVWLSMMCASVMVLSASAVRAQEPGDMPPMGEPPHHERMAPPPAGERPPHERMGESRRHEKMAEEMADDLGLTDKQREQAKKVREDGRKKVEPLMKQMKELREKMDAARKENMKEFEKILTPEQKAKFEGMKAEMKAKHPGGRRHEMKKHDGNHAPADK